MKRINFLSLVAAILLYAGNVCAQVDKTFCFIDADGNEVKNGSTVTFYAVFKPFIEEMPELGGELKADFDLVVKNTSNTVAAVAATITKKELSSGYVQFCFPNQCQQGELPMIYTSDCCNMLANEVKPLNSEWYPEEGKYGNASFSLQLLVVDRKSNTDFSIKAHGPIVNMNCIYADPAGIADMESDKNAKVIGRYDANGNKLSAPRKGLNIIKLSNGKTVKTVIK